MKSLQNVLLLFICPLLTAAATCPCGATFNSQFNKCYDFFSTRKPFVDAQQTCQDMDGQLVSIHNGFENSLVMEGATEAFSSDDFWIGGSDVEQQGTWTWTDGSRLNYTNWASGYPDSQDGHDCMAIQLTSGKWRSVGCFTSKPFICEIPLSSSQPQSSVATCPTPPPPQLVCPSEWTYFAATDSCYKVRLETFMISDCEQEFFGGSWDAAEASCQRLGAHLTSIHSEVENDFVISMAASGVTFSLNGWTFIGLQSMLPGEFAWTDGSPVNFTKWHQPDQPTSSLCGFLVPDHQSKDDSWYRYWGVVMSNDNRIRNYVCKMKANH